MLSTRSILRSAVPLRPVTVLLLLSAFFAAPAQKSRRTVDSPDGNIRAVIGLGPQLTFSVLWAGTEVVHPSEISLALEDGRVLGREPRLLKTKVRQVSDTLVPVVAEKRRLVPDIYREMSLGFAGDWGLVVRAYNDGVAYRFVTRFPGSVTLSGEGLSLRLDAGDSLWFGEERSFLTHSERAYLHLSLTQVRDTQMCCLPLVIEKQGGLRMAFTEADLFDYPGLYLKGGGGGAHLTALFPPCPLSETLVRDRTMKVTEAAPYIARTSGTRDFPWRVLVLSPDDGGLVETDLVYRLGSPCRIAETSWIRPGKVAWDWWNANNVYGVGFRSGVNTETYRYFIDFASRYGIEYIILDEGWSVPSDLRRINPDMDMEALFAYARERKVGIILWVLWNALDNELEAALDRFAAWGAAGIKVDFMQRDDQWMVNYYERVAREAARRKLLVDFHGSYKPTGFSRTYPHVLTREGVRGLENNKWSELVTPSHDVTLPFTRMLAGPMDYTPGAMINATRKDFRQVWDRPMSQGTRCHQLAMYVVYESPLQMLADSPSNYLREPEAMEFLAAVPVTWDQTRVLNGAIGEYITVARKKGAAWYIGSMTDWTPRDFTLDLGFLEPGSYRIRGWADGMNADRCAVDFIRSSQNFTAPGTLPVHLAPGGGWAAIIEKL